MASKALMRRAMTRALRFVGKDYAPDADLPATFTLGLLRTRSSWLLRGWVRTRRNVFLAPGVRMRGRRGITLGDWSTLDRDVVVDGYSSRGVGVGKRSRIGAGTVISCTSHPSLLGVGFEIGRDSAIGEYGYVGAAGGVAIGDDVIIGQYVSFHSQNHNFSSLDTPIRSQGTTEIGISIGDDCWIGARTTILDGSVVPSGCVVAAGAVVRGTFPPNAVIAGVPAKVIQLRG
jgi:carbonic anhydrase/acetyltransferase-like protein (isoleucine patch superfamily)